MIPDCKRRIKAAYNDLQTLVVSDYFPCSFCKNMSFFNTSQSGQTANDSSC